MCTQIITGASRNEPHTNHHHYEKIAAPIYIYVAINRPRVYHAHAHYIVMPMHAAQARARGGTLEGK